MIVDFTPSWNYSLYYPLDDCTRSHVAVYHSWNVGYCKHAITMWEHVMRGHSQGDNAADFGMYWIYHCWSRGTVCMPDVNCSIRQLQCQRLRQNQFRISFVPLCNIFKSMISNIGSMHEAILNWSTQRLINPFCCVSSLMLLSLMTIGSYGFEPSLGRTWGL